MEKSKQECLLMNGILGCDLGNNESRIMKAMDDYADQFASSLQGKVVQKTIDKKVLCDFLDTFLNMDDGEHDFTLSTNQEGFVDWYLNANEIYDTK